VICFCHLTKANSKKANIKINPKYLGTNKTFLFSHAVPVFSFTILFSDFSLLNINMPPIKADITRMRKKTFLSVKLSQKLVITPAIFPPMATDKNHPPIKSAVSLAGASFETKDNPIGLKNISLIVKTK
jgi:hypothetical protein